MKKFLLPSLLAATVGLCAFGVVTHEVQERSASSPTVSLTSAVAETPIREKTHSGADQLPASSLITADVPGNTSPMTSSASIIPQSSFQLPAATNQTDPSARSSSPDSQPATIPSTTPSTINPRLYSGSAPPDANPDPTTRNATPGVAASDINIEVPPGADVPLALVEVSPEDGFTDRDLQAIDSLADSFVNEVTEGGVNTTPSAKRWNRAQTNADELFRTWYGQDAYMAMTSRRFAESRTDQTAPNLPPAQ